MTNSMEHRNDVLSVCVCVSRAELSNKQQKSYIFITRMSQHISAGREIVIVIGIVEEGVIKLNSNHHRSIIGFIRCELHNVMRLSVGKESA